MNADSSLFLRGSIAFHSIHLDNTHTHFFVVPLSDSFLGARDLSFGFYLRLILNVFLLEHRSLLYILCIPTVSKQLHGGSPHLGN